MFEDRLKGIENGQILRAKGILNIEGKRIHFDYTPFVYEVREVDIKKKIRKLKWRLLVVI